jgi:hypothetical protein
LQQEHAVLGEGALAQARSQAILELQVPEVDLPSPSQLQNEVRTARPLLDLGDP